MRSKHTLTHAIVWVLATVSTFGLSTSVAQTSFEVTLDPSLKGNPVSGRLLVFISKRNPQPMTGPAWFGPEPFFGKDVTDVKSGDKIVMDNSADGYPSPISNIEPGEYNVQAILDHDFYFANHTSGEGNFYSKPQKIKIDNKPVQISLTEKVGPTTFNDAKFTKYVEIKSDLLAKFHKREVIERALVVLPASYEEQNDRRYPVYYEITGFGGTLKQLEGRWRRGQREPKDGQTEFIRVYLTGQCKWGHHVYANSEVNGPRGDALIKEMIPEIDRKFRTIAEPTARFLGGHSSGGWSSLWLQVSYPDFFGGVWSTAPDPVDFRDWQGTNLYDQSDNVYRDADGKKKPLARFGDRIMAYYEDFTKMDDVLGRGGQIRSFDAVFSTRDKNGQPEHCWDRETGKVDPEVLEHWKKYDISLLLKNNWTDLAPKLTSKINVIMGDSDTFYLEGATIKLKERMQELGSDAKIEIVPGKNHSNLLSPALRNQILTEMSEQFWKNHPPIKQSSKKTGTTSSN